jgi:homospermidine synthase
MIDFNQRIPLIGFGVVAQATLPMLLKHLRVPLRQVTVIDFADR